MYWVRFPKREAGDKKWLPFLVAYEGRTPVYRVTKSYQREGWYTLSYALPEAPNPSLPVASGPLDFVLAAARLHIRTVWEVL